MVWPKFNKEISNFFKKMSFTTTCEFLSYSKLLISIHYLAMLQDNISRGTQVPMGEEMDTKTVEFLLSDNQSYLIVLLLLMGTVIIIANR